jgi:DNA polymerase-3 subunit delta'
VATRLDLELYEKRRSAMLALLAAASGQADFGTWSRVADTVSAARSEKLDHYLEVLYILLEDLLLLQNGQTNLRNADIRDKLEPIAAKTDFPWLVKAVTTVDDMADFMRRNIQKSIALDAFVANLRRA